MLKGRERRDLGLGGQFPICQREGGKELICANAFCKDTIEEEEVDEREVMQVTVKANVFVSFCVVFFFPQQDPNNRAAI